MEEVQKQSYYEGKIDVLSDLLGRPVELEAGCLKVGGSRFPIIDDVIVLLPLERCPQWLRERVTSEFGEIDAFQGEGSFAEDIQQTFGAEWKRYAEIRPEYRIEFGQYFDLVDLGELEGKRVCDLGCGTGRWSYFVAKEGQPRDLVLLDFSDAIFVARENLRFSENAIFFMGDILDLPFRDDAFDLIYSIGVLHHIPEPCLQIVRNLRRYSDEVLVYLYYSLDNRPWHYRLVLNAVSGVRSLVSRVHNPVFREVFTTVMAAFVYAPMVLLGKLLEPFGKGHLVPLYSENHRFDFSWWRLLAYDRFFTAIEQRVSREEIEELEGEFSRVVVSENAPYWHFRCFR